MNVRNFICLFSMLLFSCSSASIYKTVSERLQLSNSPKMKVFLVKEDYITSSDNFIHLINGKKWNEFDKQVQTLKDPKVRDFLRSIRLLIDKQYDLTYQALNPLSDSDFDCQVKILKTDCLHELKIDSVDFRLNYQEARDCTSDSLIKSIAETRYRFIKYGI